VIIGIIAFIPDMQSPGMKAAIVLKKGYCSNTALIAYSFK